MSFRSLTVLGAMSLALFLDPAPARADWAPDGVPVCTAVNGQTNLDIASDSNGGFILAWQDYRSGGVRVYAQRFNATGVRQWTVDGIKVGADTTSQQDPAIVADGTGAVVAWSDMRGAATLTDIYAQHISFAGSKTWLASGVPICKSLKDQVRPVIISDYLVAFGAGPGSIIAWESHVTGGEFDIYAQAVNEAGTVRWAANGVPVCTVAGNQAGDAGRLVMCSDGVGVGTEKGAILAWSDERAPGPSDAYTQRMNAGGVQQWGANGIPVVTGTAIQDQPSLALVASGAAIVVFRDLRNGVADIYARKMGTGVWAANGLPVCTATGVQSRPVVAYDGQGGIITAWADERNSTADDIYIQRLDGNGAPKWTLNGIALCDAPGTQDNPQIISDAQGGAVITWQDARSGVRNIYAQRVDSTGTPLWDPDGERLCYATGDEYAQVMLSDLAGGAFVAWLDRRTGHDDIYATRITGTGAVSAVDDARAEPVLPVLRLSPNPTRGAVRLAFELPVSGGVSARILTPAGRLVHTLAEDVEFTAGSGALDWDGRDALGRSVSGGIYFVLLETKSGSIVRKVSVLR